MSDHTFTLQQAADKIQDGNLQEPINAAESATAQAPANTQEPEAKRADKPNKSKDLTLNEAADALMQDTKEQQKQSEEQKLEPPQAETQPSELEVVQYQLAAYEQQLAQEAASIQAEKQVAAALRKDDPGEYAARMSDLQGRSENLALAINEYQNVAKQFDNGVVQEHLQRAEAERQKLQSAIPGWNDEKKSQLVNFLRKEGYSDAQINAIPDAKTIKLAWDAMTAKAQKQKLPKVPNVKKAQPPNLDEIRKRKNLAHSSLQFGAERIHALGLIQ